MERDQVLVSVQGKTFSVGRERLSANMKRWNGNARRLGKRPGERIDDFQLNQELSADFLGVVTTVLYEFQGQSS